MHRAPVRLPGYIVVNVISLDGLATIETEPLQISIAVCLCKKPDNVAKALYDSHMMAMEEKQKNVVVDSIEEFEKLIIDFNDD